MRKWLSLLTVTALFCFSAQGWARMFAEVESRFLGNGWFQYRVKTLSDPFWQDVELRGLFINFTNLMEYGPNPSGWSPDAEQPDVAGWSLVSSSPQILPYEKIFLVHSSQTAFKSRTTRGAMVTFALVTQTAYVSSNIPPSTAGLGFLPCLVPCPPEEADGSPTNLLGSFEIIPNLKIDALLVTNSGPYGLTFSWRFNSTVRVEGTSDLLTWLPCAYALGSPPTTTWTSSVPLNNYGNNFRLGLVATEHIPGLLTGAGTNGLSSPPP